jgi:hypothetical protein
MMQGITGCTEGQSPEKNENKEADSTGVLQHETNIDDVEATDTEISLSSPSYMDGIYSDGNGSIVEVEKGFYYTRLCQMSYYDETMDENKYTSADLLMYYDKATEMEVVLCAKPDCDHTTVDCIANAGTIMKKTLSADNDSLYYVSIEKNISDEANALIDRYYKGESAASLGVEKINYTSDLYLYQIRKDGTQKNRLVKLASAMNTYYFLNDQELQDGKIQEETGNINVSGMFVQNGALYYSLECMGTVSLNKLDLGSQKAEVLETYKKENCIGLSLCHSGAYIWTQVQYVVGSDYQADIHAYCMETGESKVIATEICDSRAMGMMADQSKMYYSSEGTMWTMNYQTAEKNELAAYDTDHTYYSPVPYGDYLIVNRMDKIEIYSRKGVFVGEVLFTEGDISNGGSVMQPYIALLGISDEGMGYVRYNDLSLESMSSGGTIYSFDVNEAVKGKVNFKKLF